MTTLIYLILMIILYFFLFNIMVFIGFIPVNAVQNYIHSIFDLKFTSSLISFNGFLIYGRQILFLNYSLLKFKLFPMDFHSSFIYCFLNLNYRMNSLIFICCCFSYSFLTSHFKYSKIKICITNRYKCFYFTKIFIKMNSLINLTYLVLFLVVYFLLYLLSHR